MEDSDKQLLADLQMRLRFPDGVYPQGESLKAHLKETILGTKKKQIDDKADYLKRYLVEIQYRLALMNPPCGFDPLTLEDSELEAKLDIMIELSDGFRHFIGKELFYDEEGNFDPNQGRDFFDTVEVSKWTKQ